MLDSEQLQTIAQLVDKMELSTEKLNKAYANNDAEEFNKIKKEILDNQAEISAMFGGLVEEKTSNL